MARKDIQPRLRAVSAKHRYALALEAILTGAVAPGSTLNDNALRNAKRIEFDEPDSRPGNEGRNPK